MTTTSSTTVEQSTLDPDRIFSKKITNVKNEEYAPWPGAGCNWCSVWNINLSSVYKQTANQYLIDLYTLTNLNNFPTLMGEQIPHIKTCWFAG